MTINGTKKVLYSTIIDFDDWSTEIEDIVRDDPTIDESEIYNLLAEIDAEIIDDIRANCNKIAPSTIVAIGEVNVQNGNKLGYKIVGDNYSDCFHSSADDVEWYISYNKGVANLKCKEYHRFGENEFIYYLLNSDVEEEDVYEAIQSEEALEEFISNYTTPVGNIIEKLAKI